MIKVGHVELSKPCGRAASHSGSRRPILHNETADGKKYFVQSDRQVSGLRPGKGFVELSGKAIRTKKEIEAYLPEDCALDLTRPFIRTFGRFKAVSCQPTDLQVGRLFAPARESPRRENRSSFPDSVVRLTWLPLTPVYVHWQSFRAYRDPELPHRV